MRLVSFNKDKTNLILLLSQNGCEKEANFDSMHVE